MFERILVPLDLSTNVDTLVDAVERAAAPQCSEVTLLHVIPVIPGLDPAEDVELYEQLHRRSEEHLRRVARRLEHRGVRCDVEIRLGDPAREIVARLAAGGADLVVMRSESPLPPGPAEWGTLSYEIGVLAPCPVLLVKGDRPASRWPVTEAVARRDGDDRVS